MHTEWGTSGIIQYGQFQWSIEKEEYLLKTRGISFYNIIEAMTDGRLRSTEIHSPEKYPHQKSFIIEHQGYIYSVPFVAGPSGTIFLKTIYPSRKYTKQFLPK